MIFSNFEGSRFKLDSRGYGLIFYLRVIFLILRFVSVVSTLILEKLHNFFVIHISIIFVVTLLTLAGAERAIAGQRQNISDQVCVGHMGILDRFHATSLAIETETILG